MKRNWVSMLLVIALVLAATGCGAPSKRDEGQRYFQTGSLIPQPVRTKAADRQKARAKKPKASRDKAKAKKRPRPTPTPAEDPNFVPRGGFR